MRVYIWGVGKYGKKVLQTIRPGSCKVEGFIDNDPHKKGLIFENLKIVSFEEVSDDYDVIIIAVRNYHAILYQLNLINNFDFSKIITFFDDTYCDNLEYWKILDEKKWKIELLQERLDKLEKIVNAKLGNIGYEIIDLYNKKNYQYPKIGLTEEAVEKIVNDRCSLIRYGDGEFEIMAGNERAVFQNYKPELAERLKEIISSQEEKLLIGIANNYGSLDMYTEDSANGIRMYMTKKTREYHLSVLDKDKIYYDAYMFKCYFPYENKTDTCKRLELIKKIWNKKDIVIVEGDKTRTGYGNDLFDNACSVKRILTPTQNAFDKYEEILNSVLKLEKNYLILVVLGPTANLLVYDLFKLGYQAIDIGQIDMDYEWYKAGAKKRIPNPNKYVSQLPPAAVSEVTDGEYLSQIIEKI